MRRTALWGLALSACASVSFAQAPGFRSAVPPDCDRDCLIGYVRDYMQALVKKDASRLKLAKNVRFTENNVVMPLGNEGLWGTITGIPESGLEAADPLTGNAAWIGHVQEHGLPVYYGMRLQVRDREIVEVETVVTRTTGLPLPFGDTTKAIHDPAFNEVLKPEQRRPRERLLAVADSYFDTVELNDGQVFADFSQDCARLENGVLTTSAAPGTSGTMAQGCETQFKLGIYRINKRIRERKYFVVDEERGVVVATGFFDHANTFDRYTLTDGREMKTLLKWPNSISLVEAFKIVDSRIHRIHAMFTYVPYFMHSPFYLQPAPPPPPPVTAPATAPCDRACLTGMADRYLEALVAQKPESLPWAPIVKFTENSVSMAIGDGLWGSIRKKADTGLHVADPSTGNVAWFGVVYDHDAPAYLGLRLKVEGGKISEVESQVARARNPGPWADPIQYKHDPVFTQTLAAAERTPRERMLSLAEGFGSTVQLNDGKLFTQLGPRCTRVENGVTVMKGCEAQLKLGLYRSVDRVRDRRYLIVDEERGLVVGTSWADTSSRVLEYRNTDGSAWTLKDRFPQSREQFEIFRIAGGKVQQVQAVSVFQPYRMPTPWAK